ncbi:MAG: hypothetical protein K8S97_04385 [Anaerolineae bacterium]|nr:hypothetical protein [Anaerolineae bacterium]
MMRSRLHPHTGLVLTGTRADLFDVVWFETLFAAIDRLHDEASAKNSHAVSRMAPADMIGWLEDIIYTAQEAIVELRDKHPELVTGVTDAERSTCN